MALHLSESKEERSMHSQSEREERGPSSLQARGKKALLLPERQSEHPTLSGRMRGRFSSSEGSGAGPFFHEESEEE